MLEKVSDSVTQKLSTESNTAGMSGLIMKDQLALFSSNGKKKGKRKRDSSLCIQRQPQLEALEVKGMVQRK